MKKTYIMHFEGQLEIEMEDVYKEEAKNDERAVQMLWDALEIADIGYYRIAETDPNTTAELRVVEEYP